MAWRYDENRRLLVLTLSGKGKLDWEEEDGERSWKVHGAGFTPPPALRRPKEQDQAAPWAVDYPAFRCWATTIHLPPARSGRRWTYSAKPVNRQLGGVAYWRRAALDGDVLRTVMSRRVLQREIGSKDAAELNAALPGFDNAMSTVFETTGSRQAASPAMPAAPADWSGDAAPCMAPGS